MQTKLITSQPTRLFTFGCSFTRYKWPTWANIVAYDLDIPFYNYGCAGAGNQYIFNTLIQADTKYQFNSNDLIMVSWTNVAREDRYRNNQWVTPGNIYTQLEYDEQYVKEWACPVGYTVRDFALIKAAWELLDKRLCQFHFMKMMDFDIKNQWIPNELIESVDRIKKFYRNYLSTIQPSFYQVLWNNNIQSKLDAEYNLYKERFCDGHPTIKEHLTYLECVFDYKFNEHTQEIISAADQALTDKILETFAAGLSQDQVPFDTLFFNQTRPVIYF
jgi:hypothetical protein